MSTLVVLSKTAHTDSNIHPAAPPIACASQSNGAVTRLAAASPALSHTVEITGTSHTSTIELVPSVDRASDRLADVPEEVHERYRCASDDRGAQRDEDTELAAAREVRVRRVRAERPHDGGDDQGEDREDQTDRHCGPDDVAELPNAGQLRNIVGASMTVGLILAVLALIIAAVVW